MLLLVKYLSLFSLLLQVVRSSKGDQLDEFQRCVSACSQNTCSVDLGQRPSNNEFLQLHFQEMPLPLPLRMLWWSCEANCDYQCQDVINTIRKQENEELYQFHGKWFFVRHFHIQEPASCVFSFLNLIAHYWGLRMLDAETLKLRKLNLVNNLAAVNRLIALLDDYKLMCRIAMGAWIFSTIFHLRDLDVTEKLDYFFAGATVLAGLYVVIVRTFKLYASPSRLVLLRAVIGVIYAAHLVRLLVDWSYTYNMQVNIFWAVLQYASWAYFSLSSYVAYSHYLFKKDFKKKQLVEKIQQEVFASAKREPRVFGTSYTRNDLHIAYLKYQPNSENVKCLMPIGLSIWVAGGLIFEVFDFPPWRDLIDAHALWHLTTVVPGYIWYHWMVWDSNKLKEHIL